TVGRVVAAVAIGGVSFGLSIVLFVRGLRRLGVAQTGTLFALAPGFAALLSWAILREPLQPWGVFALVTMTAGALFLAGDHHGHEHVHEGIEHDHSHEHDAHHDHEHSPGDLGAVPHAHKHRHPAIVHGHPHSHDAHHRHRHGGPGPRSAAEPG
ncbi:MAG: EamA family transporter, partial [Gemmatimonadota bacterium]